MIKRSFHRLGLVLALGAMLALLFHGHPASAQPESDTCRHCCLCHNVGISSPSLLQSYRPPTLVFERVLPSATSPYERISFISESPRAPPHAA